MFDWLKSKAISTPKSSGKNEILRLIAILVVAFLARLFLARFETEVGVDSVHYILMGDNIAHGRSFDTWNTTGGRWILPPTFPLLIAFFRFFGAGLEWSGHLASIIAGTMLLVPLYFLTRRLFSPLAAQIAALLTAFTPILVDYSTVILTENLFACFVLAMMLFVVRAFSDKGKFWEPLLAGIFASLAFLTKTFGIFLLPFLLLSFLFGRGRGNPAGLNSRLFRTGVALIGFLLLAVPYWIGLKGYTGQWVIDGKGVGQSQRIFAGDLTEEHVDPRYSGELTPDGTDFLINVNPTGAVEGQVEPGNFVYNYFLKYLQKLVRIYQDFPYTPTYPNGVLLLYLFPTILLGLGLFTGTGRWDQRHSDRFLMYWLIPFIFGIPLVFIEVRYFIPVVPLLIPWMAKGIEEVAGWILNRFSGVGMIFSKPILPPAITIAVMVFILLALPKLTYKVTNWDDPMVSYNPRKAASMWLWENKYEPARIMEYAHSVSFYSGAQSILIPRGDLNDVIRIARQYDTDLLSLDEFYLLRAHRRPEIEYLFDIDKPLPPELELIYVDDQYPGLMHIIYRIRSTEGMAEIGYEPE